MFAPLMPPRADDFRTIDFWVFDLDNTLYPASSGLFAQIDQRMRSYVRTRFGVDDQQARTIQKGYYRSYGTTLNGLMSEHNVDPHEFLAFVHDIDVSSLHPNPSLAESIAALPGRKIVFTNGSAAHAARVTQRLGLDRSFDGVMDIFALNFRPKPQAEAYDALLTSFAAEPRHAAMFEDLPRNLLPAHKRGMTTVLVTGDHPWRHDGPPVPDDCANFIHHRTDDLPSFLRELTFEITT
jgi:putative hydrolase of the HAD superfamily